MDTSSLVLVAKLGAPWGIKGHARVHSYTDPVKNVLTYAEWHICHRGQWSKRTVEASQVSPKGIVAKLSGVESPEEAALLTHAEVYIERAKLPEIQTDKKYYWIDLQGMRVVNVDGHVWGVVDSLYETASQDNMVVLREGQSPVHLPFMMDLFVKQVDIEARVITVDWPLNA